MLEHDNLILEVLFFLFTILEHGLVLVDEPEMLLVLFFELEELRLQGK
jgi:hypothetical protein